MTAAPPPDQIVYLNMGETTQLKVGPEDRLTLVNEGPGQVRFGRSADSCYLPLPAGKDFSFDDKLGAHGFRAVFVKAEGSSTVSYDTVG